MVPASVQSCSKEEKIHDKQRRRSTTQMTRRLRSEPIGQEPMGATPAGAPILWSASLACHAHRKSTELRAAIHILVGGVETQHSQSPTRTELGGNTLNAAKRDTAM